MKKPVKKFKPVFQVIMADIYGSAMIISINQTDQQFAKSLSTLDGIEPATLQNIYTSLLKGDTNHEGRTTWNKEKNCIAIRIFDYTNSARDHAVIAHEVFHGVHRIMEAKGMFLSDDSEEAYAYLTSHFIKNIYSQILR